MLSRFSDFENTFALMDELRRRMDGAWDDVEPSWQGASSSSRALSASSFPRINFFDGGSNLVLKADVPGLSEKDVQVTLNEGGVTISGERKVVAPEGYSAHRQERSHVKFSRSLTLPCKVNPEQATASVKNGVLTITLAKAAELLLVADVPGASHDGIDVQLEKGQLTILAKRSDETTGAPIAAEQRSRDCFRVFSVPQGIDASKIDAQLSAGVLYLRPPKQEFLKPRRIDVKQG